MHMGKIFFQLMTVFLWKEKEIFKIKSKYTREFFLLHLE